MSDAGLQGISTDRADEVQLHYEKGITLNQLFIAYLFSRLRREGIIPIKVVFSRLDANPKKPLILGKSPPSIS